MIMTMAGDTLKTDSKGHAEAAFTVTNTTNRPVRGMATARALDSTKQEWLRIIGETDRDFAAGGMQHYVVSIDLPIPGPAKPPALKASAAAAATPTDRYGFRLNVASAINPDEDFAESSFIRLAVAGPELLAMKPFPKWIFIPIAAGIVLLLLFFLRLFI